jgi:hypothetical protein
MRRVVSLFLPHLANERLRRLERHAAPRPSLPALHRLFTAYLVYLISHNRPPQELLSPRLLDIEQPYHGEFAGMAVEAVSLDDLHAARSNLITEVAGRARLQKTRDFLQSVYALEPDWKLLDLRTDVSALPAVRWKCRTSRRFGSSRRKSSRGRQQGFPFP